MTCVQSNAGYADASTFNRAAAAIKAIAHEIGGLPISNYFDDFTLILPQAIAMAGDQIFRDILGHLGWDIKPSKAKPMQDSFKVLGVVVDLKQCLASDPILQVYRRFGG